MVALSLVCGCSPTRVFFVPPSRHLLCSLCDENFNEVVLPCAGGHTFCRACVRNWFNFNRICPACREAIPANAALVPNRLARAQVDELRVRCRFGVKAEGDGWVADEAGCPAQLSLDGAAAHEATCGFATFPDCGVGVRFASLTCFTYVQKFALPYAARDERVACGPASRPDRPVGQPRARLSRASCDIPAGHVLKSSPRNPQRWWMMLRCCCSRRTRRSRRCVTFAWMRKRLFHGTDSAALICWRFSQRIRCRELASSPWHPKPWRTKTRGLGWAEWQWVFVSSPC